MLMAGLYGGIADDEESPTNAMVEVSDSPLILKSCPDTPSPCIPVPPPPDPPTEPGCPNTEPIPSPNWPLSPTPAEVTVSVERLVREGEEEAESPVEEEEEVAGADVFLAWLSGDAP